MKVTEERGDKEYKQRKDKKQKEMGKSRRGRKFPRLEMGKYKAVR